MATHNCNTCPTSRISIGVNFSHLGSQLFFLLLALCQVISIVISYRRIQSKASVLLCFHPAEGEMPSPSWLQEARVPRKHSLQALLELCRQA